MNPKRVAFVAAARSFLGVRWRHRGRKPWALDCVGLLSVSFAKIGEPFKDEINYGREPWEDFLRRACVERWGAPIQLKDALPGDLPLMQYRSSEPSHIGILGDYKYGGLSLIHCHNIRGVVEGGIDETRSKMITEVYRPWSES